MSWDKLVDKLYGLRRFGIKPGLKRILSALGEEGNPDKAYEIVSVGGTNGKGTVASMIAALLQAHGYRVGLYTSPHLIDVRERFRVDGQPLPQAEVEPVLEHVLAAYGGGEAVDGGKLTFFEVTTLVAAVVFADQEVDFAVFEVGLGGRLDAVNAMEPSLSVVTTIARDHTEYLGEELRDIAMEKAGIFRAGIPAVIGKQDFEIARQTLLETAEAVDAVAIETGAGDGESGFESIADRHRRTAEVAVQTLLDGPRMKGVNDQGFERWRWPGRFDVLDPWSGDRQLVLDAAHNRAGLQALAEHIRGYKNTIGAVIWTSMREKDPGDIESFFEELGVGVWASLVKNERCRSSDELQGFVPRRWWRGSGTTQDVLRRVRGGEEGDVLIFGSVFLLGEVFEALGWRVSELVTYVED